MKNNNSNRNAAITAGLSIIIMAIAAGYSVGYVNSSLFVLEDAEATAANFKTSQTLFLSGVLGWIIIFICDLAASWGLYTFLKSVDRNQSFTTGLLRVIYTAFLGVAIYKLLAILPLINAENFIPTAEAGAEILGFNNEFQSIWSTGLIVFGFHLLGLGCLTFKSGFVPKIWGVLIMIAGVGYLVIPGGEWLIPDFENYKSTIEMIFTAPWILGELGLGVWLLFKGAKG